MNSLPLKNKAMIPGLYQLAAKKLQTAEWCRQKAESCKTDPRTASENEEAAASAEREATALLEHAKENEVLILSIETLLHGIYSSPIKSADRTLAMRELEAASMRLQRENGPPSK